MTSKIHWKYLMPFLLWTAFILVASLLPSSEFPKVQVVNFDKVVHAGIYFLLVFLGWFGFHKQRAVSSKLFFTLCTSCILFGFIIEVLQGTCTATRQFDWYDVIANTVGVLLFAAIIKWVKKTS